MIKAGNLGNGMTLYFLTQTVTYEYPPDKDQHIGHERKTTLLEDAFQNHFTQPHSENEYEVPSTISSETEENCLNSQ